MSGLGQNERRQMLAFKRGFDSQEYIEEAIVGVALPKTIYIVTVEVRGKRVPWYSTGSVEGAGSEQRIQHAAGRKPRIQCGHEPTDRCQHCDRVGELNAEQIRRETENGR